METEADDAPDTPLLSVLLARAAAICIRRMSSRSPGEIMAAAIALRYTLADHGWSFGEFAAFIEAAAERDAALIRLAETEGLAGLINEARAAGGVEKPAETSAESEPALASP